MLNFEYPDSPDRLTCRFSGQLTADKCALLSKLVEEEIAALAAAHKTFTLIFDLEQVDYISSAFLRICIAAAKQAGENNFSVINASPMIKKVFTVAGLETPLKVL